MIKGLSGFITWLCESQWSTHCIVSRKGPHVALQKSLLCHMSCLASHDISYMTWCICWIDLLYLIYDKCAWMIDISFAVLFIYYVRCHMISYIPTIYVYICLVFGSLYLHCCTCDFVPMMISNDAFGGTDGWDSRPTLAYSSIILDLHILWWSNISRCCHKRWSTGGRHTRHICISRGCIIFTWRTSNLWL